MKIYSRVAMVLLFSLLVAAGIFAQDLLRVNHFSVMEGCYPYALTMDNFGHLLVAGEFRGTVDMDPDKEAEKLLTVTSKNDIYLAKYDRFGNYKWALNIGGDPYENYNFSDMDVDADGNVFVYGDARTWMSFGPEGSVDSLWTGGKMAYLAKYDPEGNYLWAQVIDYDQSPHVYFKDLRAQSLAVDSFDGSIYIAGMFGGKLDFDPGDEGSTVIEADRWSDIFLAKYSNDGDLLDVKVFSGPDEVHSYATVTSLEVEENRNILLGGYFQGVYDMDSSEGEQLMEVHTVEGYVGSDAFLASYTNKGDHNWHMNLGSGHSNYVRSIKSHEEKIYIVGSFQDTVDFNPSGSEYFLKSAESESSGYLAAYNADGSFINAMSISGYQGEDYHSNSDINDLDLDDHGSLYLIGAFYGIVDCDPSAATWDISSTGGPSDKDMFLAKYDLDLDLTWAVSAGGNSQEVGLHTLVHWGEVLAYGFFDGDCDFDPSENEEWIHNRSGSHDLYMAWFKAYDATSVPESGNLKETQARVYPNPASDFLRLESSIDFKAVKIFSISGKELSEQAVSGSKMQIDLTGLPPSCYILKLIYPSGVEVLPFIIN